MKTVLIRGIFLIVLTLVIALQLCAQGVYWESVTTAMGMEQQSRTHYMPKMFKSVNSGMGGERTVIFRMDRGVMYEVNAAEKTYSETSFDELEKTMKSMGGQMGEKMAEVKKQMESLHPEQRKMMEQMMGAMPGAAAQGEMHVTRTDESQKISGFNCTKFVVKRGENEVATIWATKELKELEGMRRDFEEFSRRITMNRAAQGMVEAMRKVEGFPIQNETQGMKQLVTKLEKRTIPASEFEIPAGYTKVKSELLEQKY